ncbi:hypothetical protein VE04_07605 [Pseudogymnoascus sp. 24MN13]|nr:hypothetical protein VE04_07605 [Pseudogymnoascus sp. 24MN13]
MAPKRDREDDAQVPHVKKVRGGFKPPTHQQSSSKPPSDPVAPVAVTEEPKQEQDRDLHASRQAMLDAPDALPAGSSVPRFSGPKIDGKSRGAKRPGYFDKAKAEADAKKKEAEERRAEFERRDRERKNEDEANSAGAADVSAGPGGDSIYRAGNENSLSVIICSGNFDINLDLPPCRVDAVEFLLAGD